MIASLLGRAWAAAATVAAPALQWNLRRRATRGREVAGRLAERRGIDTTARPNGPLLWVHAASVGETTSILPVLSALGGRVTVLLTTGTLTSQLLLDRQLAELGLGSEVLRRFAPLDVPAWIDQFLSHWRPNAVCFVESELWPNQLEACRVRRIPLMLVNARMSDRSFRRWRLIPGVASHLLGGFTRIHARGEQDADRLRALGASHVESSGDLKFAAPPLPVDPVELERLVELLGGRPVWLAASTHAGEEALVAAAHRQVVRAYPGLLTIVVPRHPDRGAALAAELDAPRRSVGEPPPQGGLWIADTMGELGLWYRLAPIAFVGRSLIPPGGGQNPLEPARLGCAIAVGPYCGNFLDHTALLREADGLVDVANAAGLADFVTGMLDDAGGRQRLGKNAAAAVRRHADLPSHTAEALLSLLAGAQVRTDAIPGGR